MMPALHQNLSPTERDGLFDFFINLIEADDIRIIILLRAIKRAELAIDIADVGVIDVSINDVSYDFIPSPVVSVRFSEFTPPVRQCSQFFKRKLIKAQCFGLIYPSAVPN